MYCELEEANVRMQRNYTALYAYIGDNPEYSPKPPPKKQDIKSYASSWLESGKFWQAQDDFWKAVVAKIDDNLLQIP
jgi:hypothetical protein